MIFTRNVPSKIRRLEKQVADQQADLEAKDRIIKIIEAERGLPSQVSTSGLPQPSVGKLS